MSKLLLLPVALLASLLIVAGAAADTKTVQITGGGFTPKATSVTVGDTVTWRNADNADHQVVADDGSFASPVLKSGQSYSFTFAKSGTANYHDSMAASHKGSVKATGAPASMTLAAPSTIVTYGVGTTLSGAVSNQLTNEPVTLASQPYGKATQSVATTTSQANGTFAFPVTPTIGTTYQAQWRVSASPAVKVDVAPRVGFGLNGRIYVAKVTSDLSYAGRFVWVQRQGAYGWKNIKRVYFGSTSRATFRLALPLGRSVLRLDLPATQAGPGYVASTSRLLAVRRG